MDLTLDLQRIYVETANESGYKAGPEHFGYQIRALVADTDEKAQEIGRNFLWTEDHRLRGPREHNDPPGYQSGAARTVMARRAGAIGIGKSMSYEELQEFNIIVLGSPETVARKLTTTIERLSPGFLILIGCDGTIPHKDVMRSIELMGNEVIPTLHNIELRPYQ